MNVELVNATLYQPDSVLAARVETESLSLFIMSITEATHEALATAAQPEILDVIAIARPIEETEPDDSVRFWLLSSLDESMESPDRPDHIKLLDALKAVAAPSPTGPIAFALTFAVAGALPPAEPDRRAPADWQMAAALSGKGADATVIPDDLIPSLWS